MPVKHVNRKRQAYFLQESKTKTGKPKYFFSMKDEGVLVESIPDGFEVYENPDAQVFLRKIVPRLITDAELAVVHNGLSKYVKDYHCLVDVREKSLILYDSDRGDLYQKNFRFTLIDEENRRFTSERWCFRGSIDNWIYLSGSGQLATLIEKYAPHIGQESFFNLM